MCKEIEMTVTSALTQANEYLEHHNSGYVDKIVMFYNITPYPSGGGYISWTLGSKYSARHQMMGAKNVRTCWTGNPPERYFLDTFLKDLIELRHRMIREVTRCRDSYDYLFDLEAYRATDEIDKRDVLFFESKPRG